MARLCWVFMRNLKIFVWLLALLTTLTLEANAQMTKVEIQTTLGKIEAELYAAEAPRPSRISSRSPKKDFTTGLFSTA